MDPFTHGLAGAAAAQSFAGTKKLRLLSFVGFASALIADLDFFIRNPQDPILHFEIHRQFTHSLIFIPAGGLIAALLLWYFVRSQLKFKELYLYSMISYATAGLMDAMTSYGTMLLWPVSDIRFSWSVISIVDPLFTLVLLLVVGISFYTRKKVVVWLSWVWIFSYLALGLVQRERAAAAVGQLADSRGHQIERMVVKPTIGNVILWRGLYESGDRFYTAGIRPGFFKDLKVYKGESAQRIYPAESYDEYMASVMYFDIMRFSRQSEDFLIRHPEERDIIGDARFSILPVSATPLWGIRADTTNPEDHVSVHYFRETGQEVRGLFKNMLLGRDLD